MMAAIELQAPDSGSTARVLPDFGFNCFDFVADVGPRRVSVLWSEAGLETGQKRPSGSGIPLLFPFPGRIPGAQLQWRGRGFPLEAGDNRGNAIHGFVHRRAWRVVEQTAAAATAEFHAAADAPELLERWPADFSLRATYELSGATLLFRISATAAGDQPLPFGFGTHPYFRLPLGGPSADHCVVRLPVRERWELVEMLPTGRRLALLDAAAFRAGLSFADMRFDDVFTALEFENDLWTCTIHDPDSRVTIKQQFDRTFRECVVYTPPHRQAICIEPYTCVPGPFSLTEQGIDAGLRVLDPGATFTAAVRISAEIG